jgi:hypothetical protein
MRRIVALALFLIACGPKNRTTPEPVDEMALGSTHFVGLDWGMTPEQTKVIVPTLAPDADLDMVWQARMKHDGRAGTLVLHFRVEPPAGLSMAVFTEDATYPTMTACAEEHQARRAVMDPKLGPSSSENLAAYWDSETATLTLACNPHENEADVAELTFSTSALDPMD